MISNPAKLLRAVMRLMGVTDTRQLAAELDIPLRTIQRLKLECATDGADATSAISGAQFGANSANDARYGVSVDAKDAINGACGASRAPARIEPPSGVLIPSEVVVISPTHSQVLAAREGEVDAGLGVFVNCRTIRHRDFTISLDGVRMQAMTRTADEVKAFCVGHAMQWAAEIDSGKHPRDVLPQKIANFLGSSINSAKNREDVHSVRIEKAARQPIANGPAKHTDFGAQRAERGKTILEKLGGTRV